MKKIFLYAALLLTSSYGFAIEGCHDNGTPTGGGLNGRTTLIICHNDMHIYSIRGEHINKGDHPHKGYMRIADNNNWAVNSGVETVQPDNSMSKTVALDRNVPQNWRVCAVWVRSPSGTFTNHACIKMQHGLPMPD
ncbi:hypothetical protein [Nitrosomonas sp. Nm34]|uniref:hypothetical protein n=1 Tax=Nitrosomonas sp. Nm34 TaxID=1881055 RepID=UPI0008E73D37|nr:hypothetical protein [Nitrosomonas sp. Nm34]SFI90340.1 hypothetical protein SAMN05428978_105517 [Nitrosomonas sp. Nm34]